MDRAIFDTLKDQLSLERHGGRAAQLAGAAGAEAAGGGSAAGAGLGRLEVLVTGDPATSLRQLLSWSYHQLTPAAADMFALLGVHCGPDITVPAAASLAVVPRAEAARALAQLADASLAAEHQPGRYVMHDLVRGYAAEQARQALGQAGIRAAIERSLDHYLHTVVISIDVPPPSAAAPATASPDRFSRWRPPRRVDSALDHIGPARAKILARQAAETIHPIMRPYHQSYSSPPR